MDILEFIVNEDNQLVRIDKYICSNTDFSRNRVQQLIDDDCIKVNDLPCKANYKVKLNDVITIEIPSNKVLEAKPQQMDLDIVYEDKDVIVINKPKGMVVHPGNGNPDNTLVNGLLYHCKDLSGINGVLRPGIVHRIDKDTTGLLVACKNDLAHEAIATQLQDKTCARKYIALVHGVIPHEYGTIDAPIGRDIKDRQKMAVTATNSRQAITHFKVLERFKNYTLVECSLETGRTHQIRVHMQYIGYPIVGDTRYSIKKTLNTEGQMLHAFELSFIHPTTKEKVTFNADLPAYFKEILQQIKEEEK